MTCILVIKQDNGKLLFGADRQLTSDGEKSEVIAGKLVKKNGIILGAAGNYRLAHLVLHVFKVPIRQKNQVAVDYIYNTFYKALQIFLIGRGITKIASENTAVVVLGIEGVLYNINICNNDTESTDLIIEIFPLSTPVSFGSGSDYALGAYVGLTDVTLLHKCPKDLLLKKALLVAGKLNAYCDSNIDVIGE